MLDHDAAMSVTTAPTDSQSKEKIAIRRAIVTVNLMPQSEQSDTSASSKLRKLVLRQVFQNIEALFWIINDVKDPLHVGLGVQQILIAFAGSPARDCDKAGQILQIVLSATRRVQAS
jgi:hypothetical protein